MTTEEAVRIIQVSGLFELYNVLIHVLVFPCWCRVCALVSVILCACHYDVV